MLPFIVKVCGVTNCEDAQSAIDSGANALGFNFYPKSPRYLTLSAAAALIDCLRGDYLRVGVFVNPTDEELRAAAPYLDIAQIHINQTHRAQFQSPIPQWRATNPGATLPADPAVQAWLIDTATPHFGGSGIAFDWSLAAHFPYRAIIAGGLDASNVVQAIEIANPWGVDSCSRLESSPGKKDHVRVAAFVSAARQAFHARQAVTI